MYIYITVKTLYKLTTNNFVTNMAKIDDSFPINDDASKPEAFKKLLYLLTKIEVITTILQFPQLFCPFKDIVD